MSAFAAWSRPEDAGVSSAGLRAFIRAAREATGSVQFHSLILLRHGKTVCRMNWAPYDDTTPHTLYSLSKSFCSAAAGFAVSEGLLKWDSSVWEVLPEEIPEGRDDLKNVTLETLLCMGSGLDPESDSQPSDQSVTWAGHVLSHKLLYAPKTHFHYNTMGTYLVSCMVQKAAGQNIRDYLMPRLFEKLGIEKPQWDMSPQGVCCGGFGLHLSSEDIARFGQCLLHHGMWNGQQVLPKGWMELATREHIANYEGGRQEGNEWGQGYGFQFWRCMDGRFRGDGMYGQICMVDEKRDAVLAVTCGAADMGLEMKLFRDHIWTAFDAAPSPDAEWEALKKDIAALTYPLPEDDGSGICIPEYACKAEINGTDFYLSFARSAYGTLRLRLGSSPEESAEIYLGRGKPAPAAVFGWRSWNTRYFGMYAVRDRALYISLRSPGDPNTWEGRFSFEGSNVVFDGYGIGFPNGKIVFQKA
ncbi:MAG: serine hydrolase [Clostridia bacterium]|nr:serine hydrolase [Clostridia bacterium]